MLDRKRIAAVYTLFGALGAVATLALGLDPLHVANPVLGLAPATREVASLLAGVALALGTVFASRWFVARFGWARALHAELQPALRGSSDHDLVALALASGIAEELLFRGL